MFTGYGLPCFALLVPRLPRCGHLVGQLFPFELVLCPCAMPQLALGYWLIGFDLAYFWLGLDLAGFGLALGWICLDLYRICIGFWLHFGWIWVGFQLLLGF